VTLVALVLLTGCGGSSSGSAAGVRLDAASRVVVSPPVAVQSGYSTSEAFCGRGGRVEYVVRGRQVRLDVQLGQLRPDRQYAIDWLNNDVRGYTVGSFMTNGAGKLEPGSFKLFRPGEVRGIEIVIYRVEGIESSGRESFTPCR
jgi:hypothetical protein